MIMAGLIKAPQDSVLPFFSSVELHASPTCENRTLLSIVACIHYPNDNNDRITAELLITVILYLIG